MGRRNGGGTVPSNSGSRSGAGGGKRLSRWLLMAHWRCTEAFDLSLSLSPSPSLFFLFLSLPSSLFRLLCIVLSATRHLSPSHLLVPPFSLTRPAGGLFLSPRLRVNPYTNAHRESFTRTGVDPSPSTPSTLPLCVCSSGFDPARLYSLRPLDAGIPLRSPPSMLRPPLRLSRLRLLFPHPSLPPPPDSDVAVCYDLHSSRNKTSATVLRSRRR